jgi:DNA-binding CsgD family transcriptional regulator
MLGTVAEYASCYGDEQAAFAKALAYCRRHDEKTTADLCLGCLSYSLFRSGNWVRSRAIINQVLARQNAPAVSRLVAEGVMGLLLAHRGELRDAGPLLEATIRGARQTGIFGMEFFGLWGLALVEEQSGQHAAAALHYRNLIRFWRRTEDRHDAIPGLTCGGLFFADRGDAETATEFGSALDQIARETANPEAIGAAAVVAGGLQARGKNWRSAEKSFERALGAFEKRDLVLERIRVLTRLANVQRALGNHAKADQAAQEAGKRARRLGARALFSTVESTATVANGKPDSWGGLSPRQRDVARHLTAGKTNKEIAAHLGVSVRTIDMHVAHVLKRLGCRTRSEAAGRISVLLE